MKQFKLLLTLLLGVVVWLFWWLIYPYDLGFQEQNQLFLFTSSYFVERIVVVGGLADYVSEFITQFYAIPCLGAALLAGLFVCLQRLTWRTAQVLGHTWRREVEDIWYPLSMIPAMLLWVAMGNVYVMLSYIVALIGILLLFLVYARCQRPLWALLVLPCSYMLLGPVTWLLALLICITHRSVRSLSAVAYMMVLVVVAHFTVLRQYPFSMAMHGVNYYRMPLMGSSLLTAVDIALLVCPTAIALLPAFRKPMLTAILQVVVCTAATTVAIPWSFDKGTHELIAYDQLVRQENWKEIIRRAEHWQPQADIGCVSVNLALFMDGQMDKRLGDFWQCGTRGLIMPRVRDLISNVSSYEVFWRMGFVNSALRYAFDSQESEMNNRKSGRHLCRIVDCQLVNGNYAVAEKYINILSHSLFYHRWAEDHRAFLYDDARVEADKVYGYMRASRFHNDFLYNYGEMDKMLAIIYHQNTGNTMAAYYFKAWNLLKTLDDDE